LVDGEPEPWPSTLPDPAFAPDAFERLVREVSDDLVGVALLEVDCAEFPCLAHFDLDPALTDAPHAAVSAFSAALGDDGPGLIALVSETDDGAGPTSTLSLALSAGDEALPPRVQDR